MRLALRVLLPYVERRDLETFWIVADHRHHNLNRLLDVIEAGVRWHRARESS